MNKFGWIWQFPNWMKVALVFAGTLIGIIVGMIELVKYYQNDFALVVTISTIVFFFLMWYLCFHFYLTSDEVRVQRLSLIGIGLVPVLFIVAFFVLPDIFPLVADDLRNPDPSVTTSSAAAPRLGQSVTTNRVELAGVTNPSGGNAGPVFGPLAFLPATEDETLILIATFHLTEGTADRKVQDEIRRTIQESINELQATTLRVEVEPTRIRSEGQDEARALGKRYKASVVIWGEDTGVRITVNYLNLKELEPDAGTISETERTQLANPSAYAQFVTKDLPAQLTFYALYAVGQSFYTEKRYDQAAEVIEKALAPLTPDMEPPEGIEGAYFRLGWLYHGPLEAPEKAIAAYSQAINFKADDATFYYNRGTAYLKINAYKEAIADYDQALSLRPSYASAYYNRGNAYYRSGRSQEAIADYTQALKLRPRYVKALNNLCWVQALTGEAETALPMCEKAVALAESCEAHTSEAIETCEKAVVLDSRGVARAMTGDYEGAIADFTIYLTWLEKNDLSETNQATRTQWIATLEQGQNPLDETTRQALLYGN